jgi:hypothetical protein
MEDSRISADRLRRSAPSACRGRVDIEACRPSYKERASNQATTITRETVPFPCCREPTDNMRPKDKAPHLILKQYSLLECQERRTSVPFLTLLSLTLAALRPLMLSVPYVNGPHERATSLPLD